MNILGLFSFLVNLCSYTSQITKKFQISKKTYKEGGRERHKKKMKRWRKEMSYTQRPGKQRKKGKTKAGNLNNKKTMVSFRSSMHLPAEIRHISRNRQNSPTHLNI